MKPQIRIEHIGRMTRASRLVAGNWIAISVQEAQRMLALGLAQEVAA